MCGGQGDGGKCQRRRVLERTHQGKVGSFFFFLAGFLFFSFVFFWFSLVLIPPSRIPVSESPEPVQLANQSNPRIKDQII